MKYLKTIIYNFIYFYLFIYFLTKEKLQQQQQKKSYNKYKEKCWKFMCWKMVENWNIPENEKKCLTLNTKTSIQARQEEQEKVKWQWKNEIKITKKNIVWTRNNLYGMTTP